HRLTCRRRRRPFCSRSCAPLRASMRSRVRLLHHLRQVDEPNFLVRNLLYGRVEHDPTEGAGEGDGFGACIEKLLSTNVAGAFVWRFFHPHAPASCAATKGFFSPVFW